MLTEEDRKIVAEFRRRLTPIVAILDLRVFGSRVRGDAEPDSDLDVFMVVETCSPNLRQRINELAWEVGFELDRIISPLVVTAGQWAGGAMRANPLVLNIEREGIRW